MHDNNYYYNYVLYLQLPGGMKLFHESLTVGYREGCRWWSAVDLGRRLVFILFIVAMPQNEVGFTLTVSNA